MKKINPVLILATLLSLTGCNQGKDSATENSSLEDVGYVYRLTEAGANAANAAIKNKNEATSKAISDYRDWGVYPKYLNGVETRKLLENDDPLSTEDGDEYSAGDIVKTGSSNLELYFTYNEIGGGRAIDDMFLIGNHNGGILNKSASKNVLGAKKDTTEVIKEALLYPSSTLSEDELGDYDLDAEFITGKRIQTRLFNEAQNVAVKYSLTPNTGVLSTALSTNLHFSVTLENDVAPHGSIDTLALPYTTTVDEVKNEASYQISHSYVSNNFAATLSVTYYKDEAMTTPLTDTHIREILDAGIAEAKRTKVMPVVSFYFKVEDSDGNETDVQTFNIQLTDDVAPVIKKNGEVVDEMSLGTGNDALKDGVWVMPDEDFLAAAKKEASDQGYIFDDEIFGEIEPDFEVWFDSTDDVWYLSYSYTDPMGNHVKKIDKTLYMKSSYSSGSIFTSDTRCYTPNIEEGYYYFVDGNNCEIAILNDSYSSTTKNYYSDAHKTYIIQDYTVNTGTNFEYTYRPTSVRDCLFRLRSNDFDTVAFIIALGHEFNIIPNTFYVSGGKIKNAYVYFDKYVSAKDPSSMSNGTIDFTVYMEYTQEEYNAVLGTQFGYNDGDYYEWAGARSTVKFGQSLSAFKSEMSAEGFTF